MRQTSRENTFENGYCWPMPLKLNDLVTVYTSSWPKPPNIVYNEGVMAKEEREESLPQYVAPFFSLRSSPLAVLPGAASRYSRIPVSPPPSPRCIADESIPADILTHWRSMPRSRERRRPQPPTFPTLQPPSRSQTRALGRVGRRLPPLTKPLSAPIVQARRRDETTRWSTR
ncbi:hypothetical protein ALC60_02263 [Trachymyrmex zeteki]|uniref:Uncharacterized protein n=1 Tax=Mycetomoellerius zeteki TaxID=64791 RepID=A0A151XED8_9HYME|nr:hypothetical protein ALC60_02263 [Trachymyrmex zeteki]